ncbi:MAG: cytochrome c3 family protein [Sulfuricella sp.]
MDEGQNPKFTAPGVIAIDAASRLLVAEMLTTVFMFRLRRVLFFFRLRGCRGGGPMLQPVLALVLLAALLPRAEAAREIKPQRECANCHVMWMDEFKRKDVTPLIAYNPKPVVDTGKQDVVSTDRMCFSCHDGFVLDSRFAWKNRQNFHPIGVKPSKKVEIPVVDGKEAYPLNDDGKVYCGTCHSAHGVSWNQKDSPIFLRVKNVESRMCLNCHGERGSGPKKGNHPVLKKLKEIPSALIEAGARFGNDGNVICQSCHRVHGAPEDKLLVVKNGNSELCATCHADRDAHSPAEAGRKGTHPVNSKPDKVKIPQQLLDEGAKLGDGGTVICETCHKPHFAKEDAKILVLRNPQSQLCQACHADQRKVANSKHNMVLLDESDKNVRGQEVGQAGVCSACHLPHGGQGPKMWARPIPAEGDPMANLCLSCHRDGGLAKKKQVGAYTHPVGRDMSRLKGPVKLPGFSREGVKSTGTEQGRVTCASCHDTHQWDPVNPEKTSKPGDPSDAGNKFLRKSDDLESSLCRTCHKDQGTILNTKHDLAVIFPKERNIKGQTAAEAGVCGNCHLPHNGNGPRMWARAPFPGVDPVSSLCQSCHNLKGIAKDKLVGNYSHPVNAPIANIGITAKGGEWTSSRQPAGQEKAIKSLPLYDSKGEPAPEGGNVTCGACHNPHNWSSVPHADEGKDPREIKGSSETSFLRLPNDNKATLCANCHVDKGPVALSKHNLAISAPAEKNLKGKTTAETGVCGACHLTHNGNGPKMWARNTGEGQDDIEKRCASCHRKGEVAGKKLTGANSHPLRVDLKKVGGQTELPLFAAEGKQDNINGKIACATCHNLHQWNPLDAGSTAGADAKAEGDGKDSFLRLPATPSSELCANCHRGQRWVRKTEHDLAVTAPAATNSLGQNVKQSGVCGQCHVPHNAEAKLRLWARTPGKANDAMESLCRSCHAAGKVAEGKMPFKPNHPAKVTVTSNPAWRRGGQEESGYFQVFTKDGRKSNAGIITCPTCHNPHQWSVGKEEEGPGKNTEGDSRSSFLRNHSEFALCANCHGMDSLFRYKYFHDEASRLNYRLYR